MKRPIMYSITRQPTGRVYTYREVHDIVQGAINDTKEEMRKLLSGKAEVLAEAQIADQNRTLTVIYLTILHEMGMQTYGLSDFLWRVQEKILGLEEGRIDYKKMEEEIETVLGYKLEDPELIEELKRKAMEKSWIEEEGEKHEEDGV